MSTKHLILFALLGACTSEKVPDPPEARSGYVQTNGLAYYYEVHGEGDPVLVLHGGLGSAEMFAPAVPELAAAGRQVIAVDLHGHGRTRLGDRAIDLVAIGDDLAAVIDHLGHDQVDVVGYSFGGGAALRLAIQHPDRVGRLVVVSAVFAQDGFYPEMLPQQAAVGAAMLEQMKQTPMYTSYAAIAPDPGEFPRLLDAMGAWMRVAYDWRADVAKIEAPTLLVYGDADMIRLDHVVALYHLLGGGLRDAGWDRAHMSKHRLAILPDLTHYEIGASPALASTVVSFLGRAP